MSTDAPNLYRGERVLVLGAGGFIGRWVARALAERGADLVCVTRTASGTKQLAEWGLRCDAIPEDLAAAGRVTRLVRLVRPAIVFNLAGYGVHPAQRDPRMADQINARLVDELCRALLATRPRSWTGRRLVHAGSALEYGTRADDLRESVTAHPTTLYGRTKLAGTMAVSRAWRSGALPALTARLFTVFGPGELPQRLAPSLMRAARTGTGLKLTAGTQRRDFTYVEDVADGLLRLGALHGDVPDVVNLATGRLVTVRWFAETAARRLALGPERLEFGALGARAEEMAHQPVNVDRMRRLTGWLPRTSVSDGIARIAAYSVERRQKRGDQIP